MRCTRLLVLALTAVPALDVVAQDDPENADLITTWDGYSGTYADVWGDGQYAYLAHFGDAGVHIVSIDSDPPVAVEYRLPEPLDNASAQDVKVADGMLFIGIEGTGQGSVHIVDVSDPMAPFALADVAIPGYTFIHNVFYDEGFLYLADSGSNRVGIVDLRDLDPEDPPAGPITEALWIVEDVGSSIVHDITVRNGRLYACAWDSGIWIYDVSNVGEEPPHLLGNAPGNNTHSCWPTDDGVFVVTGEERALGGIKVFRITEQDDGVSLQQTDAISSTQLPAAAFSVHNQVIDGYRLYNSWYQAGLQVFDIDPATGTLVFAASYDTSAAPPQGFAGAWGVYPLLGPERVLVSDMQSGLFVVSLCEGIANDCNCNGIDDEEDLSSGVSLDCNGNGRLDECDLAEKLSTDCNDNGLLDDCESDCNCNGVEDDEDLAGGTSADCNDNGVPDECDDDCNGDGVPDECEDDCNDNGQSDWCDVLEGSSLDCNLNGIPDECEIDCNCNGVDDGDELASGAAEDCDADGVPDDCQTAYRAVSELLSPIGTPTNHEFLISDPPFATDDVTLRLAASADLNGPTEWLFVQVDGELLEEPLFTEGIAECSDEPAVDAAVISAEQFNAAAADDTVVIRVIPNATVNESVCPMSFVQVEVTYDTVGAADCNGNGVSDFCDIANGEPDDDGDGVPDACQCPADSDGNETVDVDDLVNVILDWDTTGLEHGGDVDRSGLVDVDDLVMVIVSWGDCR